MLWNQMAFILLFTSKLTVLNNYLCALDTTVPNLKKDPLEKLRKSTKIKKLSFTLKTVINKLSKN